MTQKELTNALDKASRTYYAGNTSEYSDTEFDLKLKELQKMEKESGVVYPNSPTLRVGSDLQTGFNKGEHPKPMLTIENTYNAEELEAWAKKIKEEYDVSIVHMSVKYDGVSLELHYKGGYLVKGLTRGDKVYGDDVTENIKTIKSIPLFLEGFEDPEEMFYVRGEVLLPKSQLAILNKERVANGEQPFANTRNACSGSLKQLDPKVTASRGLIFRAWDCFGDKRQFATMDVKIWTLKHLGFYYEPYTDVMSIPFSTEMVDWFYNRIKNLNLDYDFDGIVIKINKISVQDMIGTKDTRAIEWGIARKWNEEYEAKTELLGVDWQVGRTGNVTPVGRLHPVECAGVVVTNVTLHNVDFINNLGLCYNDIVRITRSGGVIPYLISAERGKMGPVKIEIPTVCPICGKPLSMDGKILKCTNKSCAAQERGKVLQFCSKDCMDIKSVGPAVVDDLFDSGLISSLSDFVSIGQSSMYDMPRMLEKLGEGYGEKKIQKIFDNMNEARVKKSWANVLSSLSIPNVGKVMARAIAKKYDSIFDFERATVEGLMEIDGVGEIVAKGIVEWKNDEDNKYLLDRIHYWGWNWIDAYEVIAEDADNNPQDLRLNGLTVCFTGKSAHFSGDSVEEFLEGLGAKCTHSVSKKMTCLIIGEKPGASKVQKASELGVTTYTEEEFYTEYGLTDLL